jgi:hypothetical protein
METKSGSDTQEDRRFLCWLRDASSTELRNVRALHVRTYCQSWQAKTLEREIDRRTETPR